MNFLQLRYFKMVAEQQHVTRAAEKLFISQPALSKSIHLLEQEVGYPLFDRTGTGISLNENGKILYKHALHILTTLENALSEISDVNQNNHQVSLSMTAGTRFLPEIIMGVKKAFPQIELSIRQEDFHNPRHTCDLYLHSALLPVDNEYSITLLSESCLIGISKENPLSNKALIFPKMLRNEVFLTMQDQLPLHQLTQNLFQSGGFSSNTSLQFDNRETIYDLIDANMGISLIPSKTWAPYIQREGILLRPLSEPYTRHIILQWPEDHYLSKDMRTIIQYLKDYFMQE